MPVTYLINTDVGDVPVEETELLLQGLRLLRHGDSCGGDILIHGGLTEGEVSQVFQGGL